MTNLEPIRFADLVFLALASMFAAQQFILSRNREDIEQFDDEMRRKLTVLKEPLPGRYAGKA
jgi:hypothetical protein